MGSGEYRGILGVFAASLCKRTTSHKQGTAAAVPKTYWYTAASTTTWRKPSSASAAPEAKNGKY